MDMTVKPGDNFYRYVNGTWHRNTEIPADKANWGSTGVLTELSERRTHEIIQGAANSGALAGTNEQKIGDLYASYMDEAVIAAKGVAPLQSWLQRVDALRSSKDLPRYLGEVTRIGLGGPIGSGVQQDLKDNSRYSVYVGQAGIGLPDRDYYFDEKYAAVRQQYLKHCPSSEHLAQCAA